MKQILTCRRVYLVKPAEFLTLGTSISLLLFLLLLAEKHIAKSVYTDVWPSPAAGAGGAAAGAGFDSAGGGGAAGAGAGDDDAGAAPLSPPELDSFLDVSCRTNKTD